MGPESFEEYFPWWFLHAKPPGTSQKLRKRVKMSEETEKRRRRRGHEAWCVAAKQRGERERMADMKDFIRIKANGNV